MWENATQNLSFIQIMPSMSWNSHEFELAAIPLAGHQYPMRWNVKRQSAAVGQSHWLPGVQVSTIKSVGDPVTVWACLAFSALCRSAQGDLCLPNMSSMANSNMWICSCWSYVNNRKGENRNDFCFQLMDRRLMQQTWSVQWEVRFCNPDFLFVSSQCQSLKQLRTGC